MSIDCFCLFIGHPRNGSSILGSLLDAHPNIVISHELDATKFINNKEELIKKIIKNSSEIADKRIGGGGYDNRVEGQWQGKHKYVKVVGDKKADHTATDIDKNPKILNNIKNICSRNVFIHTVRNPFDNIATMFLRKPHHADYTISKGHGGNGLIGYYFDNCLSGVMKAKSEWPKKDWLTIHHEDFVTNPRKILIKMISFLEQQFTNDYLDSCCNIVFEKPHRTRDRVSWTPCEIKEISNRIKEFDFLERYDFKN